MGVVTSDFRGKVVSAVLESGVIGGEELAIDDDEIWVRRLTAGDDCRGTMGKSNS